MQANQGEAQPFYKDGLPTLATLRANGKINLIEYPNEDMPVTEKPRKYLHAYLLFVKDTRNDLKCQNPGLTFKELSQLMAERWKSLTQSQRQEYELLAIEEKRIHDDQMNKYEEFCRMNGTYQLGNGFKRKKGVN